MLHMKTWYHLINNCWDSYREWTLFHGKLTGKESIELILNKFISRKKNSNEKFYQISIITSLSKLPRSENQAARNPKGNPLQLPTS